MFYYLFIFCIYCSIIYNVLYRKQSSQNKIIKDDHIIVSVNEDSTNVPEEYSSAEELIIESSEKDRNNKMYNVVKSPSGSEGKKIFYFENIQTNVLSTF